MLKSTSLFAFLLTFLACTNALLQTEKGAKTIKTLIIDGQNNHVQWPKVTFMMKQYLEETGKFSVDVKRSRYTWQGAEFLEQYKIKGLENTVVVKEPKTDSSFRPDFSKYDLVICNFGWKAAPWTAETQADFDQFIKKGGGLVVVHAADNSFPEWLAYNKMIGLGGWGNRNEKNGPYLYYNQAGELIRDTQAGKGGSHGPQSEFLVTLRNTEHPITKGMPLKWMHSKDELYDRLRGPAENIDILATAFSDTAKQGTGRNEPVLMTIKYGKGRVFHTTLGHVDYSVECVGFITTLLRGAQWAATGAVDIPIPKDFPTEKAVSQRVFVRKE